MAFIYMPVCFIQEMAFMTNLLIKERVFLW